MQPQQQTDYTHLAGGAVKKNVVLQKTYALLAAGFVPAIAGAYASNYFNFMMFFGKAWMAFIALLVVFYGLVFMIEKNRYNNIGMALFFVLTFFLGLMVGPLLQYALSMKNGSNLVAIAAAMTAGVFLTMSFAARSSKVNTSSLSRFIMVGFVVVMIGMVASFFMNIPALSLTVAAGFVILSSVIIMYQTRTIIDGGEDSYISAAVTIFISIYNIFSSLLQILMALSGND